MNALSEVLRFIYLRGIHLVEHDDGGAVVIKHQPPEVCRGVGQRMLGNDEGGWLLVALGEQRIMGKKFNCI